MPRVKRGIHHLKRRKNILAKAKGYKWGRKKKIRLAKVAITKAGVYAFRDRRARKRSMRRLWQMKINAMLRSHRRSYASFMGSLRKANIALDRKILADIAEHDPRVFEEIISAVTRSDSA